MSASAKGFREYKWNAVLLDKNVRILRWHINEFLPLKTVTVRDGCPEHITPVIKSLSCKRNKLRRHGSVKDADTEFDDQDWKKMIADQRSASLFRVESRDTRKIGLW
jgi:hypothetical protein